MHALCAAYTSPNEYINVAHLRLIVGASRQGDSLFIQEKILKGFAETPLACWRYQQLIPWPKQVTVCTEINGMHINRNLTTSSNRNSTYSLLAVKHIEYYYHCFSLILYICIQRVWSVLSTPKVEQHLPNVPNTFFYPHHILIQNYQINDCFKSYWLFNILHFSLIYVWVIYTNLVRKLWRCLSTCCADKLTVLV